MGEAWAFWSVLKAVTLLKGRFSPLAATRKLQTRLWAVHPQLPDPVGVLTGWAPLHMDNTVLSHPAPSRPACLATETLEEPFCRMVLFQHEVTRHLESMCHGPAFRRRGSVGKSMDTRNEKKKKKTKTSGLIIVISVVSEMYLLCKISNHSFFFFSPLLPLLPNTF